MMSSDAAMDNSMMGSLPRGPMMLGDGSMMDFLPRLDSQGGKGLSWSLRRRNWLDQPQNQPQSQPQYQPAKVNSALLAQLLGGQGGFFGSPFEEY